jgi:succinate dehydrogenase / fumarate reductase cytochrome b subunit
MRLASFVSLLPLGVWTLNHLWKNLSAFWGAEAWEKAVTHYPHGWAQALTMVMVLGPLVLHAVWGVKRLTGIQSNLTQYPNYGNLKYVLQRVSAVGVLFFLGAHLWLAMIKPRLIDGHAETFAGISHEMAHHLPTLIVYLLGTLGVSYHLANGLSSFAWTWGLASGRVAFRRLDVIAIGLFLAMVAASWSVIYALYRAGSALPV